MNKIINVTLVTLFAAIFIGSAAFIAQAQVTNGGDDTSSPATVSGNSNTTGSVTNGGDDVSGPAYTAGSPGTTGSVTNGGDDVPGSTSNPTNPGDTGTPGTGGNPTGSGSGPSSSSGGSSNNTVIAAAVQATPISATSSCPLLTSYLKIGAKNDPVQVAKLQAFLKNTEGINVAVTGTFDLATENAVRIFQKKYAANVLIPWGGTKTSGFVYITTTKKINQIACQSPLILNASELSIIQAFIRNRLATQTTPTTLNGVVGANTTGFSSTTIDNAVDRDEMDLEDAANTASVGNTSFAARFWNYLVNLFR